MQFPKTEKIIYEGKLLEIGRYGIKDKLPTVQYEGKAAEQYLKTNGLGLPPDP